ncbi:MFS transporter [Nesterenkonia ebinurensis]|uniref:MFS transporter n=1 Tax=Nesterenkonia ebinurensis TaxID=2608252 RepID=UPI00123E2DA7|nr:MFS transporter [Nesterenkonia ebinurensis]
MSHAHTQNDDAAPLSSTSPDTAPAPAEKLGREFHVHLGTVALNAIAGGILFAGVPLVAATLTNSPQEISVISAATQLPALIGILAGLVVDRTDRRRLRLVMMGARAGLVLGAAAVALTGNLTVWALAGLMLLYAFGGVFIAAANGAMVPQVAPRSQLAAANSRIQGAMFVFEDIVGAPIAALLVLAGSFWIFGVPGLLGVLGVVVLWAGLRGRSFRAPQGDPGQADGAGPGGIARALGDIREGLHFIIVHRVLRPVFAMSMAANFASAAYFAVFVLWMTGPDSPIGVPAELFPLYFTVMAIGAVTATLTVSLLLKQVREFPLMLAGFWCMPFLLVVQVIWPTPWVMAGTMLLLGYTLTVGNVIAVTLSQKLVPGRMLGRFSGTAQTASSGLAPLGALLGGFIAEIFGFYVLHLGVAAIVAAALVYPMLTVRQRDVDALEVQE